MIVMNTILLTCPEGMFMSTAHCPPWRINDILDDLLNEKSNCTIGGEVMSEKSGGAEGDRTLDLMNAIHALSQLSYGPTSVSIAIISAGDSQHAKARFLGLRIAPSRKILGDLFTKKGPFFCCERQRERRKGCEILGSWYDIHRVVGSLERGRHYERQTHYH